jgi:hypothetical protein
MTNTNELLEKFAKYHSESLFELWSCANNSPTGQRLFQNSSPLLQFNALENRKKEITKIIEEANAELALIEGIMKYDPELITAFVKEYLF